MGCMGSMGEGPWYSSDCNNSARIWASCARSMPGRTDSSQESGRATAPPATGYSSSDLPRYPGTTQYTALPSTSGAASTIPRYTPNYSNLFAKPKTEEKAQDDLGLHLLSKHKQDSITDSLFSFLQKKTEEDVAAGKEPGGKRRRKDNAMSHYPEDKRVPGYDYHQWDYRGDGPTSRRGHLPFSQGWGSMAMGNPYFPNPHMMPAHAHSTSDYRFNQWTPPHKAPHAHSHPTHQAHPSKLPPSIKSSESLVDPLTDLQALVGSRQQQDLVDLRFPGPGHASGSPEKPVQLTVTRSDAFDKEITSTNDKYMKEPDITPKSGANYSGKESPANGVATAIKMDLAPTLPQSPTPKAVIAPGLLTAISPYPRLDGNMSSETNDTNASREPPILEPEMPTLTRAAVARSSSMPKPANSFPPTTSTVVRESGVTTTVVNLGTVIGLSNSSAPMMEMAKTIPSTTNTRAVCSPAAVTPERKVTTTDSSESFATAPAITEQTGSPTSGGNSKPDITNSIEEDVSSSPQKSGNSTPKTDQNVQNSSSNSNFVTVSNAPFEPSPPETGEHQREESFAPTQASGNNSPASVSSETMSQASQDNSTILCSVNSKQSDSDSSHAKSNESSSVTQTEHLDSAIAEGSKARPSDDVTPTSGENLPTVSSTSTDVRPASKDSGKKKKQAKKRARVQVKTEPKKTKIIKSVKAVPERRGPVLHIKGTKEAPISVAILNGLRTDEDDAANSRTRTIPAQRDYRRARSRHGLFSSTLSARYDARTADPTWICVFCKQGPHKHGLGDLFGPYFVVRDPPADVCEYSGDERDIVDAQRRGGRNKKSIRTNGLLDYFQNMSGKLKRSKSSDATQAMCGLTPVSDDESDAPRYEVWVHELCVVWSPGVCLVDTRLHGLQEAVWHCHKEICSTCSLSGANLGCIHRNCPNRSHYVCAREAGWHLPIETFISTCQFHIPRT